MKRFVVFMTIGLAMALIGALLFDLGEIGRIPKLTTVTGMLMFGGLGLCKYP